MPTFDGIIMLKYNGKQWDDNIVELRENKEKRRYMENIKGYIEKILSDGLKKAVFSDMRNKEYPYRRITLMKKEKGFQAEKQTEKQVFHDNLREEEVADYCEERLLEGFRQVNFWGESYEYSMKISKKGKLFFNRKQAKNAVKTVTEHNRRKNYLIEEGMVPPLVDMGVFTKDGKVVNAMYDKYKQINRFIEIIDDAVEKAGLTKLHIIDFGCGKSYLTFVIYYYLTEVRGLEVSIIGLDLKADVIEKCNAAAKKYQYENLYFEVGDINGYRTKEPVDMVITLHACDTATDFALYNAVCWDAKMIISVPCCQHELCGQMESENLSILTRYGIIKERTAALMTDAIRANLLEVCGYKTQLLEFVDLSHTPKNILIRAVKTNGSKKHRQERFEEAKALMKEFHFEPTLWKLLQEKIKETI